MFNQDELALLILFVDEEKKYTTKSEILENIKMTLKETKDKFMREDLEKLIHLIETTDEATFQKYLSKAKTSEELYE